MGLAAQNTFQQFVESTPLMNSTPGSPVWPSGTAGVEGTAEQVLTAGAWVGVTGPGYELEVEVYGTSLPGSQKNVILRLYKDDAGGTSAAAATLWISDLGVSGAPNATSGGALVYRIPITVPNGCSMFASLITDSANTTPARVQVRVNCNPDKPWTLRTGTSVRAIGVDAALVKGVSLASATTEPAWTEIGTLTADICWIDFAWFCTDSTTQNNYIWVDIALGTSGNERVVINNARIYGTAAETFARYATGVYCTGTAGEKVFARASRLNGVLDDNESLAVHVVEGRYAPPTPYTVTGTVTVDGSVAANAADVIKVYALDGDDIAELVATAAIAGGVFSVGVPDNGRTYFAVYDTGTVRGVSAVAAVGGTHDITIYTGAGTVDFPAFPNISNATTADAIRDRAIDLVEAVTPTVLAGTRFRAYRNEGDGEFIDWCEANPASALRRFQIRFDGMNQTPAVSNHDHEERVVKLTTVIAYPHNARTGAKQALDRDTAIDRDYDLLDRAIGMYSRANFVSPYPDACWFEGECSRLPGATCDYLVITGSFSFRRSLS